MSWSGIFTDIPADAYHQRALDIATASGLKQVLRSPAHFRHWATEGQAETEGMAFGKLLHAYLLEPETFERAYAVAPADAPAYPAARSWAAKNPSKEIAAAMDYWRAWEAAHPGVTRVSVADYDKARRMGDSARAHPYAAGLLTGGQREVTMRWVDEATGLRCQSRNDLFLPGEYVMDVKTCQDASEEGFARTVMRYLYDVQQAHYVEGVRATGETIKWFVFLAIESEAPYVCQPHVLNAQAERRGWALRQKAMAAQAEAIRLNRWRGYSDRIIETSLPSYAFYGIEDAA